MQQWIKKLFSNEHKRYQGVPGRGQQCTCEGSGGEALSVRRGSRTSPGEGERGWLQDQQRERLTQLLKEADDVLAEQIIQCRTQEEQVLTREDQLNNQEDYLIGFLITQHEAREQVRGLPVKE